MLATHADEEAGHKNLLKEISHLGDDEISADAKFNLTLQAQNRQDYLNRLATRIRRACQQLAQKDRPTYSALEKARKDKFLGLRLQARAVKHRLRTRIRERRFESERLERSYFRSTLGRKYPYGWPRESIPKSPPFLFRS